MRGLHGEQGGHGEPRRGGNSLRTAGPDVTHRSCTASQGQRHGVGTRTPKDKAEVPLCGGSCGLRLRFRRLGAVLSRRAPGFSLSKTGDLPWLSPVSHPKRTAPAGRRGRAGPGPTPSLPKKFFDGRSTSHLQLPSSPRAPPRRPRHRGRRWSDKKPRRCRGLPGVQFAPGFYGPVLCPEAKPLGGRCRAACVRWAAAAAAPVIPNGSPVWPGPKAARGRAARC